MKELISKPREDRKRRVQLLIPDSLYQDFNIALIDKFGHVKYQMSEVSADLWGYFIKNQEMTMDPNFQAKKSYLLKLKKSMEQLINYKEIDGKTLLKIFEETTYCMDKRTYNNYRKFFRKIGILEKPRRWNQKGVVLYSVNVDKIKEIIKGMDLLQQPREYQKKKLTNGFGKEKQ